MDQINVQRWARSLRQFHRNHFQSPILTNVYVDNQNGLRNASTSMKIKEYELPKDNSKYSFTLDFSSPKKDSCRTLIKSQFYTFDMTTKDEENLHYSSDIQLSDNQISNIVISSSDHHDIDTLSDAGTYIIEDDGDIAYDDELEQQNNSSSAFKRYINQTKTRHGTFDIHRFVSSTTQTINRPIIDSNIPTNELVSSSFVLFSNDKELDDTFENKSSNIILQQQSITSTQNQIKPAEYFVISPTLKTKSFPTTNIHQRKRDTSRKSKLTEESVSIKDPSVQTPISEPISPPLSSRSYQNSTEKDSFYLEKQSPSTSPSIRPHTTINDQTYSLGSFQRNSNIRQTTSTKSQHQQQISSSSTINNNDCDETKPNFTKFYTNKTFTLRQQTSHLSSSTSKPIQQQQQIPSKTLLQQNSKPITTMLSTSLSTINSSRQTNRTVQLRRARAQAKIEELSQRTTKQLHKTDHQSDIMNTSSHSNVISHSKKELANLQSNSQTITRTNITSPRQDMLKTRTISSSSNHRSASASPQLYKETPSRYRKTMTSIVTDEEQCQKASTSVCSIEEERCDSLRDNGQRLAIRLIQLSSGILEKLKPNESVTDDNISIRELEQLVDKLETVNRTLSSIDASLTDSSNIDTFI